jgi:hypothetical protein
MTMTYPLLLQFVFRIYRPIGKRYVWMAVLEALRVEVCVPKKGGSLLLVI